MSQCLVGLGSNLGDREQTLRGALEAIDATPNVRLVRASQFHRTQPIGGPSDQGEFLNACAVIETSLAPQVLLVELHRIENRFGRVRRQRWGPRTLDLDLLLYGNAVIQTDTLVVPHPLMTTRRFVLEPATEIAGEMVHPTTGHTIANLFRQLSETETI